MNIINFEPKEIYMDKIFESHTKKHVDIYNLTTNQTENSDNNDKNY